mmetsp:Transcript_29957/g.77594  ORF Transcript_29957/g.77594 Transcript_29957/m.77594 type:complete len:221 (-) Transcript_29957:190-852(-)
MRSACGHRHPPRSRTSRREEGQAQLHLLRGRARQACAADAAGGTGPRGKRDVRLHMHSGSRRGQSTRARQSSLARGSLAGQRVSPLCKRDMHLECDVPNERQALVAASTGRCRAGRNGASYARASQVMPMPAALRCAHHQPTRCQLDVRRGHRPLRELPSRCRTQMQVAAPNRTPCTRGAAYSGPYHGRRQMQRGFQPHHRHSLRHPLALERQAVATSDG